MNELQTKEFELLKIFIDICNKLNLKYYLVCGSALGAAKYSGFIPWDDDVDVAMPRKDYDVFTSKAPEYLPEDIFLQNYKSDPNFPKIFSKLRNSGTTYIESPYKKLNMNHGVFIDVFPLDSYPDKVCDQSDFTKKVRNYNRLLSCALEPLGSTKARIFRLVCRLMGYHKRTSSILFKYENFLKSYSSEITGIYCNFGNYRGNLEPVPVELYSEGTSLEFEGISVIVPKNYDKYLRDKYGDYELDPPKEEQAGHHYYDAIDLTKSYTEYFNN